MVKVIVNLVNRSVVGDGFHPIHEHERLVSNTTDSVVSWPESTLPAVPFVKP